MQRGHSIVDIVLELEGKVCQIAWPIKKKIVCDFSRGAEITHFTFNFHLTRVKPGNGGMFLINFYLDFISF